MLSTNSNLSSPPTFPILSLHVHLLNNYKNWLLARLHQSMGTHVVTLNAEMSMMAQEDKALNQTIKTADLVIPDGAGIIIYMRLRGLKHQRCPGIELAASLIEQIGKSSSPNTLCFFGGTPGTAEQAAQSWQDKFPQLSILTQDGYVSGKAEAEWKETLKIKQPQVIFVGIGVPRQELWIKENRALCPNSIWIGVGGSLDIWAGNKARAPEWLRNNNLEWSYRLYQEPWRWRRMLSLPKFLWRSLLA
ncbi:WecB/TagA/CpsF family glycosyltransferase [Pleurocapsales cyanobacterium LEGE 10410]|nr:WecB/TagA/CpsF family glycosyltransferase [Pleurocapsales cyanobacterium LEGE 10410]